MAKTIASQDLEIRDLKNKLQAKEHELIMAKADLCRGCQYRNDYKNLFKTYKVKEQECEKIKNTLNEIEKKCSKYQTCIIVLKKDILDIINGVKDKNVLHKEKETKECQIKQ